MAVKYHVIDRKTNTLTTFRDLRALHSFLWGRLASRLILIRDDGQAADVVPMNPNLSELIRSMETR